MFSATATLYRNAYAGLTKHIWLLSVVMLINRSGTMVLAFLTLYCKQLGYSIEQGGFVVGIYGLGSILGAFLGGKLSDRFGFYRIQFLALFLGGILFIVLGQMTSYINICICTFVLSAVNESFRPANAAAIAHYSSATNRTQSFSLVRLAVNLGWGVGIAVGGLLASIHYKWLFWVDGCTSITAAFLLLLILPKVSLEEQRKPTLQKLATDSVTASLNASAWKDRTFLYFLLFILFFASCFFQLFTTVPVYFKVNLGLSEFDIGLVMAVNGLLIALVEMLLVFKMEGRKPYLYYISLGAFLMSVSFIMLNLPLLSGFVLALFSVLILTVAEMVSMPFMNSYYIGRSNERTRGSYAGLYTMAWSAAQVIGSTGGSMLAGKIGFHQLWWLVFLLCTIASAGFYWLLKKEQDQKNRNFLK